MRRREPATRIDGVVFAGGGNRCIWQVGFWETAAPALGLRPKAVSAVSAGAAMACMIFSGKTETALEYFTEATARNPKNFYPRNIVGREPCLPHYGMYRDALTHCLDEAALTRLHRHAINILIARPPRWLGPVSGTFVGLGAYSLEKKVSFPVHSSWARRIGFRGEAVPVRSCATPHDLAELILQSSCTPPFVPVMRRDGRPVLDGGLVDNVPVRALDPVDGTALVLLTRVYPAERLPRLPGLVYVQPSEPIRISKWDYTDPHGLREAYDLGRRDGERFVSEWAPRGAKAQASRSRK